MTQNDALAYELYRVYFSAFHEKRMINGYSGYIPKLYYDIAMRLSHFPSNDSIFLLRSLHVRYIIVHLWEIKKEGRLAVLQVLAHTAHMRKIATFQNDDYVYEMY